MGTAYTTVRQHFSGKTNIVNPAVHHLVIFDMDGVVTDTARIHAAAWKKVFDEFLEDYCKHSGIPFTPFDIQSDYRRYVDGKAREDGARSFLESRHIPLPEGQPSDSPDKLTIHGIGHWKDMVFHQLLQQEGVETYPSTIQFIRNLKENGVKVAIISASKNAAQVLEAAGVLDLFDTKVDGLDAEQLHLPGKPEPDVFLEAAKRLGCSPEESVVVEDAVAGVQAGEAGHFALVIGIDRANQASLLKCNGADVVVQDLSDVEILSMALRFRRTATPWLLIYEGYNPETEGLRETLCTLGNGYFATRGAAPESVDDGIHYPGTYSAGGYNRVKVKLAGHVTENEDLVNFPNWLSLNFKIGNDGEWFSLDSVELLSYHQVLDLKNGVLHRKVRFKDKQGRETLLKERRFVHMCDFHLAGLQWVIRPLNWQGKMTVRSALDGRVRNNNVKTDPSYKGCHLRGLSTRQVEPDTILLKTQTRQSELRVAQAARTRFFRNKDPLNVKRDLVSGKSYVAQDCEFQIDTGSPVTVEKIVTLYMSQDNAISECVLEACKAIRRAPDFTQLLTSHKKAWHHLWKHFDIEIETQVKAARQDITAVAGHLHIFHLLQTISPNSIDLDINIPARGWHGEAYRGHIFWDNIFVFPFFNLRMPDITESLLKYRSRRLDEARFSARAAGYEGAMYPWQSASNGEEETEKTLYIPKTGRWVTDYTHLQRHSGAAVAYNIWDYYQATGDIDFMYRYGAEMILEIARFWASLSVYNPQLDRFEIQGIVGPDEYHVRYPESERIGINNNAYTNIMAVWCLCRALEVLDILPEIRREEIRDRIGLDDGEMKRWDEISRKMRIVFLENGVISQFEGFENLAEFPWKYYQDKYGTLQHVEGLVDAEGETLEKYQIIKQADVLMLFYLFSAETLTSIFKRLGYDFKPETIPLNIAYYTCRTVHGSSLSRVANAWVLARSNRKRSWKLFQEALMNDLNDTQGGTTVGGIHLGAMGGTLDLLQRCYTGLELREGILWFNPLLPKPVKRMAFRCHYRENLLKIEITQEQLMIQASFCHAQNIQIGVLGALYTLQAGETKTFRLSPESEKL